MGPQPIILPLSYHCIDWHTNVGTFLRLVQKGSQSFWCCESWLIFFQIWIVDSLYNQICHFFLRRENVFLLLATGRKGSHTEARIREFGTSLWKLASAFFFKIHHCACFYHQKELNACFSTLRVHWGGWIGWGGLGSHTEVWIREFGTLSSATDQTLHRKTCYCWKGNFLFKIKYILV